jgi:hypothetical protein
MFGKNFVAMHFLKLIHLSASKFFSHQSFRFCFASTCFQNSLQPMLFQVYFVLFLKHTTNYKTCFVDNFKFLYSIDLRSFLKGTVTIGLQSPSLRRL